jgi:hypothetical protein
MNHKQRIFNRIWNHFMVCKQPTAQGDEFNTAMYMDPAGHKCSIGILIPEDIYKPAMEGNDVQTVLARWPMFMASLIERNLLPEDTDSEEFWKCIDFLCDMQEWHDDVVCHGVQYVYDLDSKARMNLIAYAKEHDLCCPSR